MSGVEFTGHLAAEISLPSKFTVVVSLLIADLSAILSFIKTHCCCQFVDCWSVRFLIFHQNSLLLSVCWLLICPLSYLSSKFIAVVSLLIADLSALLSIIIKIHCCRQFVDCWSVRCLILHQNSLLLSVCWLLICPLSSLPLAYLTG